MSPTFDTECKKEIYKTKIGQANIFEYLDYLFENPKCELEYNNDF